MTHTPGIGNFSALTPKIGKFSVLLAILSNHKIHCIYLNLAALLTYNQYHRDGSFEHPKSMFNLMDKKIITILHLKSLLNWPYGLGSERIWNSASFILHEKLITSIF